MGYDKDGAEMQCGGAIPVENRTAYRTYRDKEGRTSAGVLVANYPVKSKIIKKIYPPHNGFITANIDIVYYLNEIPVMTRKSQIMMRPDKSEATVQNNEEFFANQEHGRLGFEMATITKEQFEILAELWDYVKKEEGKV